jgi:enoyl-CoA hydratase/carnithine racemase
MGVMERMGPTDVYVGGKMLAGCIGNVGVMVFNHPERHNAITAEMWGGVADILGRFAADTSIRVVVLAGAGEKSFVSGGDISQFAANRGNAEADAAFARSTARGRQALAKFEKPTVSCLQGYCLGGGMAIALDTDLRIAGAGARLGIPAVRLGIAYGIVPLKKLVDLVGPSRARMVMYTGRQFNAAEALAMGLVDQVVEDAALADTVLELAQTIAGNAPLAVMAAKFSMDQLQKDVGERDMERVAAYTRICMDSADYLEGRTAFMEKRPPVFKGS